MVAHIDWKALHEESLRLTEQHATETGRVISAWNLMQDTLGRLFVEIAMPSNNEMALSIWYSQDADRAQRRMLVAATRVAFGTSAYLYKEIKWICDQADRLADDRNNVAHVGYSIDFDLNTGKVVSKPRGVGHFARADRMSTRDIFAELKVVETNCKALFGYAVELSTVLNFPHQFPDPPWKGGAPPPWPSRPAWLKSKVLPTPKQKPSRGRRKSRQRQPQSSQE